MAAIDASGFKNFFEVNYTYFCDNRQRKFIKTITFVCFLVYDVTSVCFLRNKMASTCENEKFASLSSEDMQSLLENRHSFKTKQCVEAAKRVLDQYFAAKELDSGRLLKNTKKEVAEFFINFYAEVRKQNGELYSRSSMVSIRFGLQRFFQSSAKYDIINDPEFKLSNEMLKAVLTNIKRSG